MMKIRHYWGIAMAVLLLSGCYNDDKLWDAVNEQEQRITALETWQKVVNGNIEALQKLVSENDYITSVTPVTLDGATVGYTISFKYQSPVTIYNGEKGEQGEQGAQGEAGISGDIPVISLTKGEDGNWYWTLNGELMTDAADNPIRANGQDGQDGQDGNDGQDGTPGSAGASAPLPIVKSGNQLTQDGISGSWTADAVYLSVDGGKTWTKVSGDKGETGAGNTSPITGIIMDESKDFVTFTLSDNSTLVLPTWEWAKKVDQQLNDLNTSARNFSTLLNGKKYITAITSVTGDDNKTGQKITYLEVSADGKNQTEGEMTIWDGAKGDQGIQGAAGTTPVISAVKETDDHWYWTVNGSKISDGSGSYVRADGEDGAPGTPGASGTAAPTPQLKTGATLTGESISQDAEGNSIVATAVYLSVDNGATWSKVSGDKGEQGDTGYTGPTGPQGPQGDKGDKGDAFFQSVTQGTDYLTLILAGAGDEASRTYRIPVYKAASLTLTAPSSWPGAGSSCTIGCTITVPDGSNYSIETFLPEGWKVWGQIDKNSTQITLLAPGSSDASWATYNGKLIVVLNVDNDRSIMRTLDIRVSNSYVTADRGNLAEWLTGYTGTSLTVNGRMNDSDVAAIKSNSTIANLNMEGAEIASLANRALQFNTTLQTVILPKGLIKIDEGAFWGCTALSAVTLPSTLSEIGKEAFKKCSSLTEITIPSGVRSIPQGAFAQCTSLKKVSLPEGLLSIAGDDSTPYLAAFGYCSSLTNINIPSTVTSIGHYAFDGAGSASTEPFEITIPASATLGGNCFDGSGITKLTLSTEKGAQGYGMNFYGCTRLETLVVTEGVTHMPGNSSDFRGCTALKTVSLPASFTTMHGSLFGGCTSLESITWPISDGTTVDGISIATSAFNDASSNYKIYVPSGRVSEMKSKFSSIESHIEAINP